MESHKNGMHSQMKIVVIINEYFIHHKWWSISLNDRENPHIHLPVQKSESFPALTATELPRSSQVHG